MSNYLKIYLSLFILFILLFFSFYIKDFRIDASSDTLVAQNDNDFKFFNYYQNVFPSKSNLIIALKSEKVIDKKLLKEIEDITIQLENIDEIENVFNINKAPILFAKNTSLIDLSNNNYETILTTDLKIEDVLNEFSNNPLYSDQIINKDKNITSLIINLKPNTKLLDLKKNKNVYLANNTYYEKKSEIDLDRNNLINKIRNILKNQSKDYTYYLGGVEMISNDVISFVKSDIVVFSSLVLLLVIIILLIIFKKLKWVFVILITSIFSVFSMSGLAGFLNLEITAVSANFISLMFILSISMNIHILNNYLNSDNEILKTLKIMFWPCFYTFLTTVVAFSSLIFSDIKPTIDFGIIMIFALILVLISSFTVLPLMISLFSKDINKSDFKFKSLENLYLYSKKFKLQILIINFLLFCLSIYGITKLNVENSFIKYFKKNTEIYQGMKLIDSELGGTTPLDIILKLESEDINFDFNTDNEIIEPDEFEDDIFSDDLFSNDNLTWFTESKINTIKQIHEFLDSRTEVGKVISIYSLIDVANKINKNKLTTFELSVLYKEIPKQYKTDLIFPYLNIDENMVKISARIRDSNNIRRADLINDIKNYLEESINNIEEYKVNGLLVLYNNMLSSLFSSQIKSLGFVLIAIFIMFLILFKSIKLSIIAIIPNIFASSYILGLIGLLNIPLDIMTITIAAISIGIAVDNTIHYLYRYKYNFDKKLNFVESIKISHLSVGNAVLTTSITISLGFLILCFSNFIPTVIFGFFTSLAMIFAMIGVLITLPSILHYLR